MKAKPPAIEFQQRGRLQIGVDLELTLSSESSEPARGFDQSSMNLGELVLEGKHGPLFVVRRPRS